jgi:predicted nucleotidyltransferase
MNMIQTAVGEQNSTLEYYLKKLLNLLGSYFPQLLEAASQTMVLDTGVLVAETASAYDAELGKIAIKKGRGR